MLRPSLSERGGFFSSVSSRVSPEFMLRPSLSGVGGHHDVAWRSGSVSPEFMLRPSLSAVFVHERVEQVQDRVSPEFMLRPSLSGPRPPRPSRPDPGVAGVYAPAFVEREGSTEGVLQSPSQVSPEFMLRPSLSVGHPRHSLFSSSGGVAGVYAPAFVERWATAPAHLTTWPRCRRSLCSGLR